MLNIQYGSREFNLPYAVTKTIGEVFYFTSIGIFTSIKFSDKVVLIQNIFCKLKTFSR